MAEVKKNRIIIFHFLPIELYPPVINLCSYISDRIKEGLNIDVILITTKVNNNLSLVEFGNIRTIRLPGIEKEYGNFKKGLKYFNIYMATCYTLFKYKPKSLIYYESLSSLPVVLFKFFIKRVAVMVHYHELFTLKQMHVGRTLHKFLNKLEAKFIYPSAKWISQTNSERLYIFLNQYNIDYDERKHKILPNYPSKKWSVENSKNLDNNSTSKGIIKLLHIGALSFKGMYLDEVLKEFGNRRKFEISFYSHSTNQGIINKLGIYSNVYFKGSINYADIPSLKGKFDIGLVLYKGNSLNFTYNAPNKIFEYLALDLDVWCSNKLLTAKNYIISRSYPKMLMVDFENLDDFDVDKALDKDGLEYKISPYFCERVYQPLLEQIHEDFNTKL